MKIIMPILIVLAVIGGWQLMSPSTGEISSEPVATTTAATTTTATNPAATTASKPSTTKPTKTTAKLVGVGPLTTLIALKEPLVCSVTSKSGTPRSGTLYVSPGKARANFAGSTMIHDGTNLYAWITGTTSGTKLLATQSVSGSVIASRGGVDPATDLSYACNPWTVDASLFVPPTSVSFQ